METRDVDFFLEKIIKIDLAIEKCFESFTECVEHISEYEMEEVLVNNAMKVKTVYVGSGVICEKILKLEELRYFYIKKMEDVESITYMFTKKNK